MAKPLKPFVRGGGYYPSNRWTPLVYPGGYTTMNGSGEDTPIDPLNTFSGAIASFKCSEARPLVGLAVAIEPVQSGSSDPSPTNVRPISGWTGANVARTGKNLINSALTYQYNNNALRIGANDNEYSLRFPAGQYKFSCTFLNGVHYGLFMQYEGGSSITLIGSSSSANTATITMESKPFRMWFYNSSGVSIENVANIQLEQGETVTAYEPFNGSTYNITFPDSAGTVYGGTLDVVNRKLNSFPYYSSYNGETLVGPWLSSMDVYTPDATPTLGAQVVDMGGAATSYDLSDVPEITTFQGINNIWADTGNVTVQAYATAL